MPAHPVTPSRRSALTVVVTCAAAGALALIWPGDAPWINDEPRFVHDAIVSIQTGHLATESLPGHLGVTYGPMAIWFYASLLRFIHDLAHLVVARVVICHACTTVGLAWIASQSRRLHPILAPVAILSPYSWFYSRLLWDNTLLIPLSAITAAAYVAFSVEPRVWKLWVAVLGSTSMTLIHLMCAPLLIAMAGHFAMFHRRWTVRHWRALVILGAAAVIITSPYLVQLWKDAACEHRAAYLTTSVPAPPSARGVYGPGGWLFPLLGGRVFSGWGIDYFFGERWWSSADWPRALGQLVRCAGLLSASAIALVWIGAALTVSRLRRATRPYDANFHLDFIALASILVYWLLCGIAEIKEHPHYYSGLWIAYFYLLWSALSAPLQRPTIARIAQRFAAAGACLYGASLAVLTTFLVVSLHHSGGNRYIHYGSTLHNQIDIARALSRYAADSPLRVDVRNYLLFPHALAELRDLYGPPTTPEAPRRSLRIRYLHETSDDGWVVLDASP
jgi:hypothetical protein